MNEHERAFALIKQMAANLYVEIVVHPDGRMQLRHIHPAGHPKRPDDKAVETFREFLKRKRGTVLKANGIDEEPSPVAVDARRLRDWMQRHRHAEDCVLTVQDGREYHFREAVEGFLRNYAEEIGWVVAAAAFHKAVKTAIGWRAK